MDKLASAGLVSAARLDRFGIEAIPTVSVTPSLARVEIPPPWVVKPRFGGSSVGVEVGVEDIATAVALANTGIARGGAVLQAQLTGWSDLNLAVRRHPELQCSAIERPRTSGAVYSYAEKYLAGADGMESAARDLPADLPTGVVERLQAAARALAEEIGLTGVPRIDALYDGDDRLALCEVNSIPGSLGLYLWAAAGVDRSQVVLDLLDEARVRGAAPAHWSSTTDGAALRAAGTVAAKLA
jgi:D-alanine-D-alanine ligase